MDEKTGPVAYREAEALVEDIYVRRDVHSERIYGTIIEHYSEKDGGCLSKILPSGHTLKHIQLSRRQESCRL